MRIYVQHSEYSFSALAHFIPLEKQLKNKGCVMFSGGIQVLIQAVYDIGIPILDTITWVYQNLILNYIKTTNKCNSSFFNHTDNLI